MNLRLSLTEDVRTLFPDEVSKATAGRSAALRALQLGLKPEPIPTGLPTAVVYCGSDVKALLDAAGLEKNGQTLSELAYAYVIYARKKDSAPLAVATHEYAAVSALPLSVLQRQMLDGILAGCNAGKIVFAEGSTGLGKTRVICFAAATLAANEKAQVVVAVPTVALIAQALKTWRQLEVDLVAEPLLGRGQFVSRELLEALLLEEHTMDAETVAGIQTWIRSGGVSEVFGGVPWLKEGLLEVAPEAILDGMMHSRSDLASSAEEAYQTSKLKASKARVVFTTHAMLANEMRSAFMGRGEGGVASMPISLLLDEAHAFANSVEMMFSDGLSLFSVRNQLKAVDKAQSKRARATAAVTRSLALIEAAIPRMKVIFAGRNAVSLLGDDQDYRLRDQLAEIINPLSNEATALSRLDPGIGNSIKRVCEGLLRKDAPCVVSFSPIRHLPTITMGPRNLKAPLTKFWETVERCALLSGTLLSPTNTGWSSGWVRNELHIPIERELTLQRFIEPWVFAQPTIYQPPASEAFRFTLLKDKEVNSPESVQYFDTISEVVRDVAATAKGGTLVLCTSFEAIRELAKRLDLPGRLIVQKSGDYTKNKAAFLAGDRPVWLATGVAWTGVDLVSLCDPADDFLLTDLVIPKVPFSFGLTPLAQQRFERLGMGAVRIDGAFKMRQGMGRLERRKGTSSRRMWLLDGRLMSHVPTTKYLVEPIKRVLKDYKNQRTIPKG